MEKSRREISRRPLMKAVSKNIFRLLLFTICAALSFVVSFVAVAGANKAATFASSKTAAANYAVGSLPLAMTVADFNNDGKLDLVTANYDGETASWAMSAARFNPQSISRSARARPLLPAATLIVTAGLTLW